MYYGNNRLMIEPKGKTLLVSPALEPDGKVLFDWISQIGMTVLILNTTRAENGYVTEVYFQTKEFAEQGIARISEFLTGLGWTGEVRLA